ncbi:MAG: site-specific DNA-methyltransferase [Sulfurimicrobium sp.]|nr:site-specific DNA-methyltransferase [Sulfurimicrobium sp.]
MNQDDFLLETQNTPEPSAKPAPRKRRVQATSKGAAGDEAQILSYRHPDKRRNNPDVGMVKPENDPEQPKTTWVYDPHLDPALQFDVGRAAIEKLIDDALASGDDAAMRAALEELKRLQTPYLNWSGKAERLSFEVDTVSLHVHERIDPMSILAAVRRSGAPAAKSARGRASYIQPGLFDAPFENLPLRDAIDFYRHERGWANRMVAGDSLLVMNSLLHKEGMAGQVQMIYLDPPYGIKYGSNFQPFVGKRDVKDRKDEDLTQEPEMIKAFRDTWELGIHSYLTYLRDRLLLARELLSESGSVFVQISDENLHHVREIMDEVFGAGNFVSLITFRKKTMPLGASYLEGMADYLVWYGKDRSKLKYRQLFEQQDVQEDSHWSWLDVGGSRRKLSRSEINNHTLIPSGGNVGRLVSMAPPTYSPASVFSVAFRGKECLPRGNGCWITGPDGMRRLIAANRIETEGVSLQYLLLLNDYPLAKVTNLWGSTIGARDRSYVVQTSTDVIERCLLMTTDPGDLVLDPTCGSGTTAFVAEKWGRRWITCDTSRVAVTLARQRLMTASYDYFELKYPHEGLRGGFIYKTVPHVTLKSIANNPEIDEIWGRMHPAVEAALGALNAALVGADSSAQGRINSPLQEWEIPFDFPADWPEAARAPFDAFHAARQAMQKQMDASIAAHADQETLYDQPGKSRTKLRVTGPFTVEAVPFPSVKSLESPSPQPLSQGERGYMMEADASIARSGESARQHQWRDELLKSGIRGKGGQMLKFAELETLPGTRYLHVSGALADSGERVVVSFGPEHAALEQRQVALALNEAEKLRPAPKFIVFCAFTFDPEAAKDIDETLWPGVTLLKAQMNTDLLTEDLKKARTSNQSFWLMGQPDVEVRKLPSPPAPLPKGEGSVWYEVEVHGFDYFDTAKGELVSGGKSKIAVWLLDTDYDERSLFPRQVFFPMAGKGEGWDKLKKDIRAELDESQLPHFHGTVSLPFEAGDNRKVAVKIVDDRGIESLKIIELEG